MRTSSDGPQARVGTMLRDKWRLDSVLGQGGMAVVYSATHRNGARAALKVLHPELASDPDLRRLFLSEGYVANKVGHVGAVSVLDDDVSDDGTVFLVMELLEGESLDRRLERCGGRLAPDDVLCIVDQLLSVLLFAHARGIVHCDLKPENLFVTRTGLVKVLDFGIAGLMAASLATDGIPVGTPAFMPPEQARGLWHLVDARSDLWAVGATMFTLLSGRFLHGERTQQEFLMAAASLRAPSLASVTPELPARLVRLVDRVLELDPAERWPDAATMQKAVRRVWNSLQRNPLQLGSVPASGRPPHGGLSTA